jgi:hypothetical protein
MGHTEQERKLAKLSVSDLLRTAEDTLFGAVDQLAFAATAWVDRNGIGDWTDVEQALRIPWTTFQESIQCACNDARVHFQKECQRLELKLSAVEKKLDQEPTPAAVLQTAWSSATYDRALAALTGVSLDSCLKNLQKACLDKVKEKKEKEEKSKSEKIMDRIEGGIRDKFTEPLYEKLKTQVLVDMEAMLRVKSGALLDAAGEVAKEGARLDTESTMKSLSARAAALRGALEKRYAWHGAYDDLLSVQSWVVGDRRHEA